MSHSFYYNLKYIESSTLYQGRTECLRLLAETERVEWNRRNNLGETPLYSALYFGFSDIVDIIVQQPNIDYNVKTEERYIQASWYKIVLSFMCNVHKTTLLP